MGGGWGGNLDLLIYDFGKQSKQSKRFLPEVWFKNLVCKVSGVRSVSLRDWGASQMVFTTSYDFCK